jgi:hypothetical protein
MAVVVLAGWLAGAAAQQTVLEVITLKYRSADQVVPMLRPLLAPGGTISGLQNRIILRTTPDNLAELRKVLDVVDAAPRRLLISVRQDAAGLSSSDQAELSGSVGAGDVRVTVPGSRATKGGGEVEIRRGDDAVRARAGSDRSTSASSAVQTLQVLEGNEAWIQVGQSAPAGDYYQEAGTGFGVRPRLSGDRVTLEISTRRDSLSARDPGNVDVQRVDTVVTGRLGEWMELGSIAQQASRSERGTLSRDTRSGSGSRSVYVKVDEMR